MKPKVIVIGGGLGGLSAAIRLAVAGFEVQLYERNAGLGGKMNQRRLGAYLFDTGPTLLTMPFVLDELFAVAGFDRQLLLPLTRLAPLCRYFFADGSRLDAHADEARMLAALKDFAPGETESYRRFIQYSARIYQRASEVFLFTPLHEFRKVLRPHFWPSLWHLAQIDPLRSMHRAVDRHFTDPRLVQLFDRYATYNGSDPYQAPATLNIIAYVEHVLGGYYINGGMYRLVEVLREIASKLGVGLHSGRPVKKIVHDGRKVLGVELEDKSESADYVLCNADVVETFNTLIEGFARRRAALNRLEPSLSGMVFLWGISLPLQELEQHNVFFSADYQSEFNCLVHERRAPDDPTVYVAISAKADAGHAPSGGSNCFVMVNMPYLQEENQWQIAKVRAAVLRRLRKGGLDLEAHIEYEEIITPDDFYGMYRTNRGGIYGIASNDRSTAFKRPPNRSRDLRRLYFAGGSSHPGGGIPLVLLSGKMAAELITEEADNC